MSVGPTPTDIIFVCIGGGGLVLVYTIFFILKFNGLADYNECRLHSKWNTSIFLFLKFTGRAQFKSWLGGITSLENPSQSNTLGRLI